MGRALAAWAIRPPNTPPDCPAWVMSGRVHTFDLVHMRRDFLRLTREFTDGRPLRSLGTGVKR